MRLAILLLLAFVTSAHAQKPKLTSVAPEVGEPGSNFKLIGTNLGETKNFKPDGRDQTLWVGVSINGGEPVNAAGRGGTSVSFRMPLESGSGTYKVKAVFEIRKQDKKTKQWTTLQSTSSNTIAVSVVPVIKVVKPRKGAVGTKVIVGGLGFTNAKGSGKPVLTLGGKKVSCKVIAPGEVTFVVPKLKVGRYTLTATVGSGKKAPTSREVGFDVLEDFDAPELTKVVNKEIFPGSEVTLEGKGLRKGLLIQVNQDKKYKGKLNPDGSVTFTLPVTTEPGSHKLRPVSPEGDKFGRSINISVKPLAPVAERLDSPKSEYFPGQSVTIVGSNFGPKAVVYFQNKIVPSRIQFTQASFTLPSDIVKGTYACFVQLGNKKSKALRLTIVELKPKLISADTKGRHGQRCRVRGEQFGYAKTTGVQVFINGVPAATEWMSDRSLRFGVPMTLEPGSYKLEVRIGRQSTKELPFTIEPSNPNMDRVIQVRETGGRTLKILGGPFFAGTTLKIGSYTATIRDLGAEEFFVDLPDDFEPNVYEFVLNVPKMGVHKRKFRIGAFTDPAPKEE